MKKLLTGFIIGAITLQMAACGSATTEPVNEQTQETANQTEKEMPYYVVFGGYHGI